MEVVTFADPRLPVGGIGTLEPCDGLRIYVYKHDVASQLEARELRVQTSIPSLRSTDDWKNMYQAYDIKRTADDLKQAFTALKGHEVEVMLLLRSVADALAKCPELGEEHALVVKWTGIRQVGSRSGGACTLAGKRADVNETRSIGN